MSAAVEVMVWRTVLWAVREGDESRRSSAKAWREELGWGEMRVSMWNRSGLM